MNDVRESLSSYSFKFKYPANQMTHGIIKIIDFVDRKVLNAIKVKFVCFFLVFYKKKELK